MSMGTDNLELLPMRNETIPGAARFFSAGRGITRRSRGVRRCQIDDRGGRPQGGPG